MFGVCTYKRAIALVLSMVLLPRQIKIQIKNVRECREKKKSLRTMDHIQRMLSPVT